MRWMERYPDAVCSLTHGFPWRAFLEGDAIVLPDDVWEPFRGGRCNLEVCFPVRLGDVFDFPYKQVWPTLETMLRNIGADHLLWGTGHAVPEPLLHLPPITPVDRELLRVSR